jgi:ribonuclease R
LQQVSQRNEQSAEGRQRAVRALLAYLQRADYRPLPQRQLLHQMQVTQDQRPAMRRLIRELLEEGRIVKGRAGRIVAASAGVATGILHRHRDGFGFVVPDGGGDDVFIPPRHLGGAFSGDRVVARVTRRGRRGRLEGVIVDTVQRRSRRVLGVLRLRGRSGVVQPFDSALAEPLHVPASFRMEAEHNDVVYVEMLRGPDGSRSAEGKVLEVLGHLDEPGTDVTIVARKYGLVSRMAEEALDAARELPSRVGRTEVGRRRRLDDPPPVTIDGETAQDFDDAIAVRQLPGGRFRLYVHIADVSHFIRPGSALDREAARRGTSVYFPGCVLPMFPEKLSNDLCSLRPGVDRLVQSVILDIDPDGSLRKTRFADGVIRSAARLTYTQVSRVLEGERQVRGVPRRVLPMLRVADSLRQVLEARRGARGSIDFDLPEPRILLDVEGVMTGITIEPRNAAHRLIEECMLIANEAVALHLERKGPGCMYRVHEAPDPAKLEILASFVRSFGLRLSLDGEPEPGAIQRLIEQVEGRPEASVIGMMALRSMKQARYAMENSGHFGLAAPTYCHFTSPIRRYPDLTVHRLLRESRGKSRRPADWEVGLDAVAESSSELERNAEAAERELLTWKKITFIRNQVGQRFSGVVTGVTRFGLFVQLTDNLVEGLLHVERLGEERFEFDESRQELRGSRSGQAYRLGDRLEVRVERVDRVLLRVDFSLGEGVERRPPRAELRREGGSLPRRPARSRKRLARGSPRAPRHRR